MKKAGWPRPKLALGNEGHVGQAWGRKKVLADGETKFGKKIKVWIDAGHFRCSCGSMVRVDKNGFAACESCGEIFNDRPGVQKEKTKKRLNGAFRRNCTNKSII